MNLRPVFPYPVSDVDLAFPANGVHLVPGIDQLPEWCKTSVSRGNDWAQLAEALVFNRVTDGTITARPHITDELLSRCGNHMRVVMGCYGISHEHKIAGLAFLLHAFFRSFEYKVKVPGRRESDEPVIEERIAQSEHPQMEWTAVLPGRDGAP